MTWIFLVLKWLHVLAACLYVGGSIANGLAKTLGDREGSESAASALRFVRRSNRAFLIPASFVLPASGIPMAWILGTPLLGGWLLVGLVLFAALSVLLVWAVRLEERLLALAEVAAKAGEPLPREYLELASIYATGGGIATVLLLSILLLMVARQAIL